MKRSACLLLLISATTLLGCGGASDAPQLAAAAGTVTWKGKPLADASVAFTPDAGPVAIGQTDDAGHFILSTQGRPGAAIGTYRVTIQAFEPLPSGTAANPDPERPVKLVSRIPAKFSELAQSGLDATVTPKGVENKFEFDLK